MFTEAFKATIAIRLFALVKIPLVSKIRPRVVAISEDSLTVKVPFRRRNRNHIRSMYFGALSIGAELTGGVLAMNAIRKSGEPVVMVFKSFHAEFLKRAEGHTCFVCDQGRELAELVQQAAQGGERVEREVRITATVPDKLGDEPVAEFRMTISLKRKESK